MTTEERKQTGLANSTSELRKLILEHPDYPLLVFAGQDACCGDYCYTACYHANAYIGEFLDCQQIINDERVFTDRDDFQEAIEDIVFDGSDQEFEQYVENKLLEYDPFWKPCIILNVDN